MSEVPALFLSADVWAGDHPGLERHAGLVLSENGGVMVCVGGSAVRVNLSPDQLRALAEFAGRAAETRQPATQGGEQSCSLVHLRAAGHA